MKIFTALINIILVQGFIINDPNKFERPKNSFKNTNELNWIEIKDYTSQTDQILIFYSEEKIASKVVKKLNFCDFLSKCLINDSYDNYLNIFKGPNHQLLVVKNNSFVEVLTNNLDKTPKQKLFSISTDFKLYGNIASEIKNDYNAKDSIMTVSTKGQYVFFRNQHIENYILLTTKLFKENSDSLYSELTFDYQFELNSFTSVISIVGVSCIYEDSNQILFAVLLTSITEWDLKFIKYHKNQNSQVTKLETALTSMYTNELHPRSNAQSENLIYVSSENWDFVILLFSINYWDVSISYTSQIEYLVIKKDDLDNLPNTLPLKKLMTKIKSNFLLGSVEKLVKFSSNKYPDLIFSKKDDETYTTIILFPGNSNGFDEETSQEIKLFNIIREFKIGYLYNSEEDEFKMVFNSISGYIFVYTSFKSVRLIEDCQHWVITETEIKYLCILAQDSRFLRDQKIYFKTNLNDKITEIVIVEGIKYFKFSITNEILKKLIDIEFYAHHITPNTIYKKEYLSFKTDDFNSNKIAENINLDILTSNYYEYKPNNEIKFKIFSRSESLDSFVFTLQVDFTCMNFNTDNVRFRIVDCSTLWKNIENFKIKVSKKNINPTIKDSIVKYSSFINLASEKVTFIDFTYKFPQSMKNNIEIWPTLISTKIVSINEDLNQNVNINYWNDAEIGINILLFSEKCDEYNCKSQIQVKVENQDEKKLYFAEIRTKFSNNIHYTALPTITPSITIKCQQYDTHIIKTNFINENFDRCEFMFLVSFIDSYEIIYIFYEIEYKLEAKFSLSVELYDINQETIIQTQSLKWKSEKSIEDKKKQKSIPGEEMKEKIQIAHLIYFVLLSLLSIGLLGMVIFLILKLKRRGKFNSFF